MKRMEIDMRTEKEIIEKQRLTMIDEKGIKYWACEEVGELIRCKDCKYWQDNNNGYLHEDCKWRFDETPDKDDYCSGGERKEETE